MTRRVMLLGVLAAVVEDARQQLDGADVDLLGGTSVHDVRAVLAEADVDHVILGGGLELDTRLAMIREVFQASDRATVHMKDQMSGPEGFLPFVRAVLGGLRDYDPRLSPRATLRAQRPDLSG